jgi:manganese/zinc/iron transport system substrate-binding protein
MLQNKTLKFILAFAIIYLFSSTVYDFFFKSTEPLPAPVSEKSEPYVMATTTMLYDLASVISGGKVPVRGLVAAGVDPHLYQPTRDDVVRLENSALLIANGLNLEGRMTDLFQKFQTHKKVLFVADRVNEAMPVPENLKHDPHIWMDVTRWKRAANLVADEMITLWPQYRSDFESNLNAYQRQLDELDAEIKDKISSLPSSSRVLVTAHDAFNYFALAYGIEVHGIQGISTESEAGLQKINELVEMLVERKIPAVFIETTVSDRNVKSLIEGAAAKGQTVKMGGTLFSDSLGNAGTPESSYIGMMRSNLNIMVTALASATPPQVDEQLEPKNE